MPASEIYIRMGEQRYAASRFTKMKRKGDHLLIFFGSPREVLIIHNEDEILAAIEEVKVGLNEIRREQFGGGWTDDEE